MAAIRKNSAVFCRAAENEDIKISARIYLNYKSALKDHKRLVAEIRDAPRLIRDLQQIINGTERRGRDYLPWLAAQPNWLLL